MKKPSGVSADGKRRVAHSDATVRRPPRATEDGVTERWGVTLHQNPAGHSQARVI